jgi:hypothetical protein
VNNIENFESNKKKVEEALADKVIEINDTIPIEYFNIKDWYFAGGCIYSIWNNKEPKDYDMFCKSMDAIKKIRKWFKKNKDKADIITKNAISMGKFQFVVQHIGKPEIEVGKFDFKHNMFYYDNEELSTLSDWEYIESNKLEFNSERARDILNIMTRIPKFVNRGMDISQKEILDILELGTRPSKYFRERKYIKKVRSGKSVY